MMRPGWIELLVMPCAATSRERPLAQECTAAFAEFAALMPRGSELDVMLTIRPQPRLAMSGIAARARRNGASVLMWNT